MKTIFLRDSELGDNFPETYEGNNKVSVEVCYDSTPSTDEEIKDAIFELERTAHRLKSVLFDRRK